MRGQIINTGDLLRTTKDGVTWYDNGTKVSTRSKVNLVGFTVTDDPDTKTITIEGASNAGVTIRKDSGADVGTRPRLNFIEGTGIDITATDDAVDDEVDITIATEDDVYLLRHELAIITMSGVTAAAFDTHGTGAITAVSGVGATTNLQDSTGHYVLYGNGDVNGVAGWQTVAGLTRRRYIPNGYFTVKARTSAAPLRVWVGLRSANLATVDDPGAGGIHVAAFKYRASESANWRAYTSDAATNTITDTGVAVANDTRYKLGIAADGSQVVFTIDDAVVATHTTTLPGIDTTLQGQATATRNAGTVEIAIARMYFTREL